MARDKNELYLLFGSNIEPEKNLVRALTLIQSLVNVTASSSVWESPAVGSSGPNFLNAALAIRTEMEVDLLRQQVLRPVEQALGRVRVADKNAPRTIDIDPIIYNGELLDAALWQYPHIAVPISELFPTYRSESGSELKDVAAMLKQMQTFWLRSDLSHYPFATNFGSKNVRRH
jgi:2-amino-4-hydroxy-6-hydroxymethyldihydropteridine diphosphokinase